jgi:isoaspartyl peptidase/L-asparaginase-like protein (Ntn-hydrolase superfamily)
MMDEVTIYERVFPALGQDQADAEIAEVGRLGGEGGVIVMNPEGEPAFSMNTSGMYRGFVSSTASAQVAIYADEWQSEDAQEEPEE